MLNTRSSICSHKLKTALLKFWKLTRTRMRWCRYFNRTTWTASTACGTSKDTKWISCWTHLCSTNTWVSTGMEDCLSTQPFSKCRLPCSWCWTGTTSCSRTQSWDTCCIQFFRSIAWTLPTRLASKLGKSPCTLDSWFSFCARSLWPCYSNRRLELLIKIFTYLLLNSMS